jgi:AcrR family transcriptional regulator
MAIIVDKVQKKRDIALSCEALLLSKGIKNLTIAEIAKTAGVGKGTIYEYFNNKDEIVFEIITLIIEQQQIKLADIMAVQKSTKAKLYDFMSLLHQESKREHIQLYREFIAISLQSATPEMLAFSNKCHISFIEIIKALIEVGIERGEIIPQALGLVDSLMVYATGLVVEAQLVEMDALTQIEQMLESLFDIIEIKEER